MSGLSSVKDGTDEIGACNRVDDADVQKLFKMLLEEKKEFEKKQFQILQDYISEQKNSKHKIESLATDKAELQEKINVSTSRAFGGADLNFEARARSRARYPVFFYFWESDLQRTVDYLKSFKTIVLNRSVFWSMWSSRRLPGREIS